MTTEISNGSVLMRAIHRPLSELENYIEILETEVARLRELEETVIQYALQQDELKWADSAPEEIFDVLLTIINSKDNS